MTTSEHIIGTTKNWIQQIVIGLNLCPFASLPFRKNQIRYRVFEADTLMDFPNFLEVELDLLRTTPVSQLETTILILPKFLNDFYDYLDLVAIAENLLAEANLEGILQIATFHPDYQFAGTDKSDVSNFTNRAPYPILHLLREDSLTEAIKNYKNTADIPKKNIAKLRLMGLSEIEKIYDDISSKN